eukprot:g4881.t1
MQRRIDVRTRLRWLTDRAFAMHVDDAARRGLFFAAEMNDVSAFRAACGLSSGVAGSDESRDTFDRRGVLGATATLVGGGDEVISLMHFLCALTPLRREMITILADADPKVLVAKSSVRGETPAMWAAALGNLPALHLLRELSARLLGDPGIVLSSSGHGSGSFGANVAHYAVANEKLLIISYIAHHHPRMLIRGCDLGLTPMHVAARLALQSCILLLCQIIAKNDEAFEEGLERELMREDSVGDTVLDTMRVHMKASKLMIGLDIASVLFENMKKAVDRRRMNGDTENGLNLLEENKIASRATQEMDMLREEEEEGGGGGRGGATLRSDQSPGNEEDGKLGDHQRPPVTLVGVWRKLGLLTAYVRSLKLLPVFLSKWLWTRGRRSLMALPLCLVAVAVVLSFVGVFYWPGHGPFVFGKHAWAMWMWVLSTTVLLGSLAALQIQNPGYVQVKDHMKSAYRTCVLVGPPDSSTIEETAIPVASRSGLFGIESMRAKNWVFLVATLTTVLSYVNLFAKWREPACLHRGGLNRKSLGLWSTMWCVLNGPVMHSCLLLFVYAPLFVFAGAILWKQVSFWRAGETMVGREYRERKKRVRRVMVCGGLGDAERKKEVRAERNFTV